LRTSVPEDVMRDSRFRPASAVRASISDDGLVLLDLDGGVVLSSNAVGGRIFQLIEQRRTPAEIASRLVAEYDVQSDRAQEDVLGFVASLLARGVITEERRP
jgi:hypothetical protein